MQEGKIQINTSAYSDVGTVRKTNEDSYFISKDESLIIVCDGMGGAVAGGLASKIAVETIKDIFYGLEVEYVGKLFHDIDKRFSSKSRLLIAAVRLANRRLFNMAMKFPKLRGMGTTVVALTIDHSVATMVHVGDSRILRYSGGQVFQLTEDHSWLNELIEDNEINEEQIETFSQKNVITRALGTAPTVKIDIHSEKYKKDDIYILCTDGLHNSVKSQDIKKCLQKNSDSLHTVTKKLIEKAKVRDGSDNITTAVVRVNQNSNNSDAACVSATIPNEDEKIETREDKFIQERYGDSKQNVTHKPHLTMNFQQKLRMAGIILVIALFSFLLGVKLNASKPIPASTRMPAIESTLNSQSGHSGSSNIPATGKQRTQPGAVIKRSALTKNAVLAIVFFNSTQDFVDARMDERSLVLDKLYPYQDGGNYNNFSIFVIDSTNNVIYKTSGFQLPDLFAM
ncbi:MAG: Stp1/IreP family PP2C-type Ser/Thr phosphatase [bacterium]